MRKEEFQIFFSGAEQPQWFKIIAEQTNAMLVTYTWLKRWGIDNMTGLFTSRPDIRLIIDSGAYTLNTNQEKYQDKDEEWFENYIQEYVDLVRVYKDHVFACVEVDLGAFVSDDTIERWRNTYFKELEEEGIQVIYVWHRGQKSDGFSEFQDMCSRFNYIAFSCQEVDIKKDFSLMNKMFSEARKTNTLIHGLAATGMEVMSSFPFYTVDSSTYVIGSKFREIAYFDGKKLKRLKKKEYKAQYLNQLVQQGADKEKIEREDIYELVSINIRNLLLAEKYIKTLNKKRSYWLEKEEIKMTEVQTLERGKYIPLMYEDTDMEDYQYYLQEVGLPTNIPKDDAINLLVAFREFCSDEADENTNKYSDDQIYTLTDLFGINGDQYNTRKKLIDTLIVAFRSHARGTNTILYDKLKTMYSPIEPIKERKTYSEIPSEYATMELEEKDINKLLSEYDVDNMSDEEKEEILQQNKIEVHRDEKGRFVKGQALVRKPKNLLSNSMPRLTCNFCTRGAMCQYYQEGYVCYYEKEFSRFDSRDINDVKEAISAIVDLNTSRLQRATMFEIMDGGIIDPEVTKLSKDVLQMIKLKSDLEITTIKQIRTTDGTNFREEMIISNPKRNGILEGLIKNAMTTTKTKSGAIEAEYTVIDEDEEDERN